MKIVLAGGGTGGHFYPLIAVAEAIRDVANERRLISPRIFYVAPQAYDEQALFENEIEYVPTKAGRLRRYASILNFFDAFVTAWGVVSCVFTLFRIYPDVVFSKGGFASVPVVLAAKILRIPVVIHESDAKPGRANLMASKFAERIGIAFASAIDYFPKNVRDRVAIVGIPIRKRLLKLEPTSAVELLKLDPSVPTVLILGGSSGSRKINDTVLGGLAELLEGANVVHQTGKDNYKDVEALASVIRGNHPNGSRYHVYPYLSAESLRQAAGAAHLIVSRAGATAIAEIALWGRPSILIPIPEKISHDQRTNAYAYAHTGAAVVLEQDNMTPHLLVSEIKRITENPAIASDMAAKSAEFANPNAARVIAEELLRISLGHEPELTQQV